MSKIIIGIHGLANKPLKEVLADAWRKAIAEGLEKNLKISNPQLDLRLVYWADLLYKNPLHDEENFNFDALYNEEPYVAADDGALKAYKDGWMDDVTIWGRGLVGGAVDQLKQHFGMDALADWLMGKLLKDLAFYYDADRKILDRNHQRGVASQVLRGELREALMAEKDKEMMLIAHSMGSIIAYDALRDLGREVPGEVAVKELVTIGSPLGLPHVMQKIREERQHYDARVRTPSIVTGAWINHADRKDPVAADPHLADDYEANDAGVGVRDDLVLNDYHKPNRSEERNHHKSYGYLRTPEMSAKIKAFLG